MILNISEAREFLRLDGYDNDIIIASLLEAIPGYIEVTTGMTKEQQEQEPLAKTAAKFILQLWYDPQGQDTEKLKRTIDSLLVALTAIGRTAE